MPDPDLVLTAEERRAFEQVFESLEQTVVVRRFPVVQTRFESRVTRESGYELYSKERRE